MFGEMKPEDRLKIVEKENGNLRYEADLLRETLAEAVETRKERDRLLLQVREYQAGLRKVDGCCNCLKNVDRFKTLDRGIAEPKCEDCNQEKSNCLCVEKRNH